MALSREAPQGRRIPQAKRTDPLVVPAAIPWRRPQARLKPNEQAQAAAEELESPRPTCPAREPTAEQSLCGVAVLVQGRRVALPMRRVLTVKRALRFLLAAAAARAAGETTAREAAMAATADQPEAAAEAEALGEMATLAATAAQDALLVSSWKFGKENVCGLVVVRF